jgi:methionyl-tRNA formyltransferase
MRLVLFAYHDVGYECLKYLVERGEAVVAVVTHQDDPGEEIWFRSVADLARFHKIPVYTPKNPNTPQFIDRLKKLAPELIFSFYYRRLLSQEILAIPRRGGINLHGSLLPRYRGRAPINWVLVNGEKETGMTLHYMTEEADAGDIIAQKPVSITDDDTAYSLFNKMTMAGIELLKETFPLILEGKAPRIPQNHALATICGRRRPEDGNVDWTGSARSIYNLIRAVTHPYPGAFTCWNGKKLFLWSAALVDGVENEVGGRPGTITAVMPGRGLLVCTGEGKILIKRAQLAGKSELDADRLATYPDLNVGTHLGA